MNELFYSLISVIIVGLISLVGLITLSVKTEKLKLLLIYFISFSAGALFGDAFIHLLPEAYRAGENISLLVLAGILLFFSLEKIICWQHCHLPITKEHVHRFAYMNLIGDGLHNFIDGLIIASSYLVSFPVGLATTIAVLIHEIPQEIGDFGILVYSGFSRFKALIINLFTALTAVFGVVTAFILSSYIHNIQVILVPIAAGGFIYIAGSDLIPELHKHSEIKKSLIQILAFILGVFVMFLLLFLE